MRGAKVMGNGEMRGKQEGTHEGFLEGWWHPGTSYGLSIESAGQTFFQ